MTGSDSKVPLYDLKDEVRKQIDAFEWKHSWHLPTDQHGYIDWWHADTYATCRDVLQRHMDGSMLMAERCRNLLEAIDWTRGQKRDEETDQ